MMSRQLLMLRHAKSDWNVDTVDFDRPLNKRGEKAAGIMGKWMRKQGLIPDWIISSPARRAQQTIRKVCKTMGIKPDAINFHDGLYQADVRMLLKALAECPRHTERVLLVGHNPELEALLDYLLDSIDMPEDGKLMATATLARLKMPEENCAELVSIVRAAAMDKNNKP